jgi:peptidoglycan/LPS O-acetylase OafA/YrhL
MQISNIQMLRAIAAILVVLHHALPHYAAMGGDLSWIRHISAWGFLGVDIFFVISGFIMAYTTFHKERGLKSAKTFMKHRLFRIYLGYWPFFLAAVFLLLIKDPAKLHSYDLVGSFFLTNADMFQLVLPVSWSLSYELYFYVLFAATLFISVRSLYRIIPAVSLGLFLLTTYLFWHPVLPASFFYSPFLLEFFAGVLIYMYRDTLLRLWILPVALLIGLYAYRYGILHESKNGWIRIMTFGTGAAMTLLVALILEKFALYRAGKLLVSIGNASYTLYLSHLLILGFFYYSGLRDLFTSQSSILFPLLGLCIILLLCIIFSLIYYRYIEKPVYTKAIHYKRSS